MNTGDTSLGNTIADASVEAMCQQLATLKDTSCVLEAHIRLTTLL